MEWWWRVQYGDTLPWVEAPSEAAAVRRSLEPHPLGDRTDDARRRVGAGFLRCRGRIRRTGTCATATGMGSSASRRSLRSFSISVLPDWRSGGHVVFSE